jgi:hypothetical protein
MTFSATGLPPGLVIEAGGEPGTALIHGNLDFEAAGISPYSVTVTAVDGHANDPMSDQVSFNWSISNTNRPPVIAQPPDQHLVEGMAVHLSIEGSDPDTQDTLTYSAENLPGALSINPATGVISGQISANTSAGSPYLVTVRLTDDSQPAESASVTFVIIISRATMVFLPLITH